MHRFAEDLDLSNIVDQDLNQICVGRYDVQFRFASGASISLQGRAEILHDGEIVAAWNEEDAWSSTEFQNLLNRTVAACSVKSEHLLEIVFPDKWRLRLYDESDQFESMTICGLYDDGKIVVI